jgi:hypothetical protein
MFAHGGPLLRIEFGALGLRHRYGPVSEQRSSDQHLRVRYWNNHELEPRFLAADTGTSRSEQAFDYYREIKPWISNPQ